LRAPVFFGSLPRKTGRGATQIQLRYSSLQRKSAKDPFLEKIRESISAFLKIQ
jgi:hypothetical protein